MRKKGVFFAIDALIGALLLLGGLYLVSTYYAQSPEVINMNLYSEDLIKSMSLLTIEDLSNDTYIAARVQNGTINNTNNTLLEQVGEFWAKGDLNESSNLVFNLTDGIIPKNYGFSMQIDNDTIYSRSSPSPTFIASTSKMVSGLEKAKPVKGFVSNARATNIQKETSKVFLIMPQGSGWRNGNAYFQNRVVMELPPNISITNVTLFAGVHTDNNGPDAAFNINNICFYDRNSFTWFFGGNEGNFAVQDALGCMLPGNNTLEITRFNNDGYNAHTHPGFRIEVIYEENETIDFTFNQVQEVSKKIYFDETRAYRTSASTGQVNGVWATMNFDLPPDSFNWNVLIQIAGRNITDYTGGSTFSDWGDPSQSRSRRDWDYIMFLNQQNPVFSDANPVANPLYVYTQADLAGFLQTGTNTLSVYLNNFGDTRWGTSTPKAIYSNPLEDPGGSSFVEVNYSIPPEDNYGLIEITRIEPWGGAAQLQKTANFSFPAGITRAGDVYLNIAQRASWDIQLWAEAGVDPPTVSIFRSPGKRQVPPKIFVPPTSYSTSPTITNFIRTMDYGSSGNWFLGESSFEYSFYMPSFVGYGDVFGSEEEAISDALARLNASLGAYIDLTEAVVENTSIDDVPSMWGPATVKVPVWS